MKSIRKCDEKITAEQLGVKVGDKFVVLPPEESYKGEKHCKTFFVGQVVEFWQDDGTGCPVFKAVGTSGRKDEDWAFETFGCLARYEEDKELPAELSLQNVKFDMKAIAEELGVSLEKAHNIVQTALFGRDVSWYGGKYVNYTHSDWLFVDKLMLIYDDADVNPEYKPMSIKPQYSFT